MSERRTAADQAWECADEWKKRAESAESSLAALRLRLEELAKGMHGAGFHVAAGWLETALSEGAKGGENAAT